MPPSSDGEAAPGGPPADTLGRYQIRGLLGTGGMGQVFTALDLQLGRAVALKLVRPEGRTPSSRARTRLLREAQALARLQHPNVVAVHDVGTAGREVFIAMELVEGPTLSAWLAAAPRGWRAIRDVFVAAGRGLVAAHEVGTVHRDFKPSNVIVGASRVVVIDFGLACGGGAGTALEDSAPGLASTMDVDLTFTGERVGTLRYMAPEQHAGRPVTALADQFAFAAALWEAIYGEPPYPGQNSASVLHRMASGPPVAPPRARVPEHIRAALARALAFRPEQRWPALTALLGELVRDPAAARRRFLTAFAVSFAALAAPVTFIVAGNQGRERSCAPPETRLWDESARGDVRAAFLATGRPFAADSYERIDTALRARVAAWSRGHEEACAATEIRHEQSAELMDARMACLGRAEGEIATFVEILRSADAGVVERAAGAAATVGDIESCADSRAMRAVRAAAPRDPSIATAADALDREVARISAVATVGRWGEASAAGPALVERARALGHPPALLRALFTVGGIACDAGDPRQGAALLYEAARTAVATHDDLLAARIYTSLVYCAGVKDEQIQAGRALAETAEAALARVGSPLELRAKLYRQESRLERVGGGSLIKSFAYAELALLSYTRLYGEESTDAARSLGEVASVLERLGAYRGAVAASARALPVLERTLGPMHPAVAAHLSNLGAAAGQAGDLGAAADFFERALAIAKQNWLQAVPSALRNLAMVREQQGQLDVAEELVERAHVLAARTRRPDHPEFAEDLRIQATIAADRGALPRAEALAEEAVALRTAAYGPTHPTVSSLRVLQADIARRRGDGAAARRFLDEALAAHRRTLGPRHPSVAGEESLLGQLLLDAGQAPAAVPLLDDVVAILEQACDESAPDLVTARTRLAEALLATGDIPRARAMAERAVAPLGLRADLEGRARLALSRALAAANADAPRAKALERQARAQLASWAR